MDEEPIGLDQSFENVSRVIDPQTGLDLHVAYDAGLMLDILSFDEVCEVLVNCGRATPEGLTTMTGLIAHAQRKGRLGEFVTCLSPACKGGHNPEWWGNFVLTVRANLFLALATRDAAGRPMPGRHEPLVNACKFLAWGTGAPYLELRQTLRRRAHALGQWVQARSAKQTSSGLLVVRES